MAPTVAVVGGGVSGISTALVFAVCGWRTTLHTALRADTARPAAAPPRFATPFAAASVIPRSVRLAGSEEIFAASLRCFEALADDPSFGVRRQRHHEVFESPPETPTYLRFLAELRPYPTTGEGVAGAPRRPGAEAIYGWSFRLCFVEMPVYLQRLYRLFEAAGGTLREGRLERSAALDLAADVLVDCAGCWAPELFPDARPAVYLRGHLVRIAGPPAALRQPPEWPFSYSYTPDPALYRGADGRAADLYFYPRRDAWLLGGSRQRGAPAADGGWNGETTVGATLAIAGVEVPRPIVALNRQFLLALTGVDVDHHRRSAYVGYRFVRDPEGVGVRLELSREEGRPVVHNYGHGGSGITLSWGCAVAAAGLAARELGRDLEPRMAAAAEPALARLAGALG